MVDKLDQYVVDKLHESRSWFAEMFVSVWSGFIDVFERMLMLTWRFWLDHFGQIEDGMWQGMLSVYKDSGLIDDKVKDSLYDLRNIATPYDVALFIGLNLSLSAGYLTAAMAPAQAKIAQAANKEQRPGLPQYRDVLAAAFIAPERSGEVREIMAKQGFTDADIDLLFLANYRLYDMTVIKDLYLRKILSVDKMYERMRELGFTDTRIQELVQGWELIPGPQDLFWMVGKEAFEPDIIEMLGLGDEFPADQVEWLQKQGISEWWAKKYWAAHWDQPSIQMGFEMLHRGVIEWDVLDTLFKTIEMPPYWREKLTEIAYRPYSRVDVRRMHDMGVLDESAIFKAYTDIGYDATKAQKMTEFTIKYNQQNDKELTKSQIIRSYISGLIIRQDAKDMLITIGFPDTLAEYNLILAEFERDMDYQDDVIKNIGDRFSKLLIGETEARSKLNQLNLPSTQLELLIDKWKLSMYTDTAMVSKTDTEKFYLSGYIERDNYYTRLRRLGYAPVDIDLLIQLSDIKKGVE